MPSEARPAPPERAHHLHPASLLFSIGSLARRYLLPALLFFFFARGDDWQRWLLIPFALLLGTELVKYFTLTYRLTADELVIRSGLLARTERHIPYERVQNIELVENALHRILRVAELRLQTGGGTEPEAQLRVVSRTAVEELRAALLASKQEVGAAEVSPSVLLRLPLREVALHGLITGRGFVLFAAITGVLFQYDIDWEQYAARFIPVDGLPLPRPWKSGPEDLRDVFAFEGSFGSLVPWIAVFVSVLAGLRLLAAAWAVVRLYDFTLERTGDGLQSRYGLLTRLSATIPRARVQALTVQEGVLHRWLKRASVRVDTAGQFKQDAGQLGSQWVAPIVRRSALLPLLQEVQPDAVIDPPQWTPVHRRAFTRIARLHLIWTLLATLVAGPAVGPLVVVPALLVAGLVTWHARRLSSRLAIALTPTSVIVRTGAFGHRRSIARFSRVQSVSCTHSPFDRRWGMARVRVDTAGGSAEHRIEMPYLEVEMAREIYQRLRADVTAATRP